MTEDKNINYEYIAGINPVYSLITENAGRRKIYRIIVNNLRENDKRINDIITQAENRNIIVEKLNPDRFYEVSPEDINSQGILAYVSPYNYADLDCWLGEVSRQRKNAIRLKNRLVILDGVTDAGNFGSIIRNCSAFGSDGIIVPKRRSAALNERVSKISAGALEKVKVFRTVNLVRTIKKLKDYGFWIYGTTLNVTPEVKYLSEVDFTFPMALVLGSEDKGISRLVSDNCDIMISIKLSGSMQSLNVSVASGIILYKIQEQIEKAQF
jgi:23S rRNA (guanosine2251-2'-O)-methyltransferase